MTNPRTCCIEGCESVYTTRSSARGMCQMHYTRWLKHGDPHYLAREHRDHAERFWAKVDVREEGECWPWLGVVVLSGRRNAPYGQFSIGSKRFMAHRFAYEIAVGPIPRGLQVDHVLARGCTRTDCVNPAHLEPVTAAENLRRSSGVSAANFNKTCCINGHEFTPENTREWNGARHCRACARERARRYRAEAKAMHNEHRGDEL